MKERTPHEQKLIASFKSSNFHTFEEYLIDKLYDEYNTTHKRELLIAFLKWRNGEQLSSETITEIDNFIADEL